MKKKAILLILAVVMMASFTACAFKPLDIDGVQDTSYVVTSNGGMAVQYGNYIYFANGYRSYEDKDGDNNIWGEVVQGGISRIELIKEDDLQTARGKEFVIDKSGELSLKHLTEQENPYYFFENGVAIDENDEEIKQDTEEQPFRIDIVNSTRIVPKNISPDSKGNGGIYIYDNWIYYASRNNQRDKNGNYQYPLYDFFRTKTDGTGTQRIHTTSSGEGIEYTFYKQGEKTYLVVLEGGNLVSIEMSDTKVGKRKNQRQIIAENVTGVIFPERDVYYAGISTDTANDYVYFTRNTDKDERPKNGSVLEVIRPDGSARVVLYENASADAIALKGVSGGSLFFTDNQTSGVALMRIGCDDIPALTTSGATDAVDAEKMLGSTGSFSAIHAFRTASDAPASLLFTSGGKLQYYLTTKIAPITLVSQTVTIVRIEYATNYIYFKTSDGALCRTSFDAAGSAAKLLQFDGAEFEKISEKTLSSNSFFHADIAGDHIFYLVQNHYDWATDYVYAKRASVRNDEREIFVGNMEQENPLIDTHREHLDDEGEPKHDIPDKE